MTNLRSEKSRNRVREILLGIVGTLVAQYLILYTVAFYTTRDLVSYADSFFMAVDTNNMAMAYGYLSKDLQANVDQSELKSYLNQISIANIQKTNWKSRFKKDGKQGAVEGGVTTDTGDVVPIRVNFVKGDNGWKIDSIEQFVPVNRDE